MLPPECPSSDSELAFEVPIRDMKVVEVESSDPAVFGAQLEGARQAYARAVVKRYLKEKHPNIVLPE
jgi:hypothetical protein